MKLFKAYSKEIRELHYSIIMAVVLAGYTLTIFSVDYLRGFLDPAMQGSLLSTAINSMVIWIAILIIVTYIRLQRVSMDTDELNTMLEGMSHDVVLVVNPNRKIVMCNEGVSTLFGYTPDEVMNQDTSLLYKDRRSAPGEVMGIYEQLERFGFHYGFAKGLHKDGSEISLEITTGNLRGRPGAVLQIREATEQNAVEESDSVKSDVLKELEYHVQRLKETEASRDALAQMIVHDMKTPLQVVTGNLELMEQDLVVEEKMPNKEYLKKALRQSRRLVQMVDGILQINKMENGSITLSPETVDFGSLVKSIVDDVETLLGDRSLTVNIPEQRSDVKVDSAIIQRVINNLLTNSIQHGGEKVQIVVEVRREGDAAMFHISNNGPSIQAENRGQIFEKFVRFKTESQPSNISMGLGLSFCKLAVEAHQGEIGVDALDEGCGFWFSLPLA